MLSWLKAKRLEKGYTLEDVAKVLNVDVSYISKVEQYMRRLSKERLQTYLEILEITKEEYEQAFKQRKKGKLKAVE